MAHDDTPTVPGPWRSLTEFKAANEATGHRFFTPDTMRYFNSRTLGGIYSGRFFITSERFIGSDGSSPGRFYTVRIANDDGTTGTLDGFQAHRTARSAHRAIERYYRANYTN